MDSDAVMMIRRVPPSRQKVQDSQPCLLYRRCKAVRILRICGRDALEIALNASRGRRKTPLQCIKDKIIKVDIKQRNSAI